MKQEKKNFFIWLLFSKIFVIILVSFLIFLLWSLYDQYENTQDVNTQIDQLKQEIITLEQNNFQFAKFIDYLNSKVFLEKEAREKMNLKKEDEKVIVLKKEEEKHPPATATDKLAIEQNKIAAMPILWWQYFFE